MNNVPCVCIMIPTFNQANFIVKAVESALAQDYPNIDIVIADDCSTDNTAEILQPMLTNSTISYKKNKVNIGRVANYKKCLQEYAAADWVINLDGDDYYTNNHFISTAMQAIQSAGAADVLFFQGVHIFKTNRKEKIVYPKINCQEEIVSSKDYFLNYFKRNYFSHMSTLYNRQLALGSNFYGTDIISSDILSVLTLCINNSNKKVIVSKSVSGVWLQHHANLSNTPNFFLHAKNLGLYTTLYRLGIAAGYNKGKFVKWVINAYYLYIRSYFLMFLKK
jgi:glycosyltransferase involved in cell wall biosynthesis